MKTSENINSGRDLNYFELHKSHLWKGLRPSSLCGHLWAWNTCCSQSPEIPHFLTQGQKFHEVSVHDQCKTSPGESTFHWPSPFPPTARPSCVDCPCSSPGRITFQCGSSKEMRLLKSPVLPESKFTFHISGSIFENQDRRLVDLCRIWLGGTIVMVILNSRRRLLVENGCAMSNVSLFLLRTSRSCSWVQNPTVSYLLRRMKLNLWTLQPHDRFLSESRNRREKSNYQTRGRNRSKKEQKGSKGGVDIYYFWGRAGNMPAFDDETSGDEAFGDETFSEEVCDGVSGKNVESLLGQFVY